MNARSKHQSAHPRAEEVVIANSIQRARSRIILCTHRRSLEDTDARRGKGRASDSRKHPILPVRGRNAPNFTVARETIITTAAKGTQQRTWNTLERTKGKFTDIDNRRTEKYQKTTQNATPRAMGK